ncbi:MAG: isoprenylcysteine carboxylmethyltransferase family protein [Candidatus Korobacteraceae bacterium]
MLMSLLYSYLFPAMWVGYSVYWWAMSRDVKETEREEPASSRITRLVLIICAFALLWLPRVPLSLLNERFLPLGIWCFWSGAAITAGGLLFSVWARRHLGKNWSQAVTLKEDHELITTGPYALVRHPIYTGLLLGFIGCAVARGEWRGLIAVALVFVALWRKLRLEEKWMRAQFGASYESYSRHVAALVPYIV